MASRINSFLDSKALSCILDGADEDTSTHSADGIPPLFPQIAQLVPAQTIDEIEQHLHSFLPINEIEQRLHSFLPINEVTIKELYQVISKCTIEDYRNAHTRKICNAVTKLYQTFIALKLTFYSLENIHCNDTPSQLIKVPKNKQLTPIFVFRTEFKSSVYGIDNNSGKKREFLNYLLDCNYRCNVSDVFHVSLPHLGEGLLIDYDPNMIPLYVIRELPIIKLCAIRDLRRIAIGHMLKMDMNPQPLHISINPTDTIINHPVSCSYGSCILPSSINIIGPLAASLLFFPTLLHHFDTSFTPEEEALIRKIDINAITRLLEQYEIEQSAQHIFKCAHAVIMKSLEYQGIHLHDLLIIFYLSPRKVTFHGNPTNYPTCDTLFQRITTGSSIDETFKYILEVKRIARVWADFSTNDDVDEEPLIEGTTEGKIFEYYQHYFQPISNRFMRNTQP